ncbi:MAG TPA: TonB-dependent receptor [Steroidobacteraceae bacterium]|nr:TonB-dependent receptor [Steroidobacteraceae bacterium]
MIDRLRQLRHTAAVLAAAGCVSFAPALRAQTTAAATNPAPATEANQEVIVTGTRVKGMEAAESPAPIQIISSRELQNTGKTNLIDALAQLVPSYVAQGYGFDMANQTLQARMYGLSPNHVLILVNGKRRHTTANLAIDGGPYQGGAGADLSFIPMDAVDHVEVLTEGAAAQYGSDAIAGVINIILKSNSSGGSADATYGGFFDGGGDTTRVGANAGFEPIDNSYFNVTAEDYNHGHTDRGDIDPRVIYPGYIDPADGGTYPLTNMPLAPGYPNLNLIQGDGEQHKKLVSYNAGFGIEGVQFYSFGTYGYKNSASYENYRLPNVAYYTSCTADCTAPLADQTTQTTYPFPYGFNPLEQGIENDFQLTGGVKGVLADWNWDAATEYGEDHMDVYTIDSTNPQLYIDTGASPNNFYDGKFVTTQWTTTLDLAHDFDVGLAGPMTLAFGGEYRRETFQIGAGDASSYIDGGAASFPGFAPYNETLSSRKVYAGYVDLAAKVIDGLRFDVAGRHENYSDFGGTTVGKFTGRWDATQEFAVRGTVSTGFRAPTLAEEHYTAVNVGPTTAFGQLAPDGPGASLLGLGNGLKPEKSTNESVGLVFRPLENLSATLDAYQIQVDNRIVGAGPFFGTIYGVPYPGAEDVNLAIKESGLSINPVVLATGTTGIDIWTNGINTRTRGMDLALTSPNDYALGHVDWSIGATYNYTSVTHEIASPPELGGQPLFGPTTISDLTTATPRLVLNLGAHWDVSQFYVDLHEIVYGPSSEWDNDDGDNATGIPVYYKETIGTIPVTNLELGVHLLKSLTFALGATNLFNRYPNQINPILTAAFYAYQDNSGVQKYPDFSPFGIDGGFYYARVNFTF